MSVEKWVGGAALLLCGMTVGFVAVQNEPGAAASGSRLDASSTRHPQLCGVSFVGENVHFAATGEGAVTVEAHRASEAGLVMSFDTPTDSVDFLVQASNGQAPRRAYLVAFDGQGRVLDVDAGAVGGEEAATMQVTADGAVIHAAQYYVARAADGASAAADRISDLEFGTSHADCL